MNEMYDLSIVTHNYSVVGIWLVVLINIYMLMSAHEISKYKRVMQLFTPIGSLAIASVIFTGVIMMAAKHLSFTIENSAMIFIALVFIILEVKRAKTLKYTSIKEKDALKKFKPYGLKILAIEALMTLAISIWMWS